MNANNVFKHKTNILHGQQEKLALILSVLRFTQLLCIDVSVTALLAACYVIVVTQILRPLELTN